MFAHALAGQVDAIGIVNEAVEDSVGDGGVTKHCRLPPFSMGWCLI